MGSYGYRYEVSTDLTDTVLINVYSVSTGIVHNFKYNATLWKSW